MKGHFCGKAIMRRERVRSTEAPFKVVERTEEIPVKIMVIIDGYAMVRRSDVRGGMPFIVDLKDLEINRVKP